jgi:hypothetical protein
MHNLIAYTLVDITNSGINRSYRDNVLEYNQQQNLNTLIQTIGIRSQPLSPIVTTKFTQDLVEYEFGTQYQGLHTVWELQFGIEHSDVFSYNSVNLYHLNKDTDGIAIISNLTETVSTATKCFETTNQYNINLYFK